MISHEHRCIFVHIPKTAGNSVNRVFGVGWEDHKDLQRYSDELPRDVFESYFKFAIVRNPWDRLLSDYNYQLKKSRAPDSKLFVFAADGSKRNFAQWLETALAAPDRYNPGTWGGAVSAHIHRWSPQVDWITVAGEPRVDFVARLERLSEDFDVVTRRVNLPPVRLPHRNRRLHWHYSHYYDRSTREVVAAYYARDIEQFGYEFEDALLRLAFNWPFARRAHVEPLNGPNGEPHSAGESGEAARTFSFAAARPPARRRIWQRHPLLAAAASVALLFGTLATAALVSPLAEDAAAIQNVTQETARTLITRSGAPAADEFTANLYTHVRRLRRTMDDLNLKLEVSPSAVPGSPLTLAAMPMAIPRTTRSSMAGVAVAASQASTNTAPHWWIRRLRGLADD